MTLAQRLARLERHGAGDGGDGVLGIRRIDAATRTGPDVVRVPATGETLTEAEFRRRYPQGLLVHRMEYATPPDDAA